MTGVYIVSLIIILQPTKEDLKKPLTQVGRLPELDSAQAVLGPTPPVCRHRGKLGPLLGDEFRWLLHSDKKGRVEPENYF